MAGVKREIARWARIGVEAVLVFALLSANLEAGVPASAPARVNGLQSRAMRLFDEGRYAEATSALQSILNIEPSSRVANILLSFALARQGQVGPAVAQTRRALDLFPTHVKLQLLLAGLLGLQDATRNESIQRFEAVLRADPTNPIALMGLAENELRRRNFGGSIQYFTRLAERFPDDARFQVRIAQSYVELGYLALARDAYARAYALAPTNVDAVRSLAILADVMDQPENAVRYYRELVALFPTDVWVQLALRASEESLTEPRLAISVQEMRETPLQTYLDGALAHSSQLRMRQEQINVTKWRSAVRFLPSFYVSPSHGRFGETDTSNFNYSFSWNIPDLISDPYGIQLKGMKADLEAVRNNLMLDVTAFYYQRLIEISDYEQSQRALALDPRNVQLRQTKRALKYRISNLSERLRVLTGTP